MSSGSFGYPISSEDKTNCVTATSSQTRQLQKENAELKDTLKKSQLEIRELKTIIQELKDKNAVLKAKELYDFMPCTFHTHLEQRSGFAMDFRSGVDSQCSTSLNCAWDIIAIALKEFKLTANILQIGYDRSQDADIIKLLKFDPEKKKYPRYPPIFFPGLQKDLSLILCNPALPMVAVYSLASQFTRGLLFGPKSLDENATNAAKGVINGTIGQIWQITKVTPGFMSIALTYLRFMLLPDKEFTSVGAISGIEYEKDCKDLKHFLLSEADSSTVQEIVKFWDKIIFSGITSTNLGGDEGPSTEVTQQANFTTATIATTIATVTEPEHLVQTNEASAQMTMNQQIRDGEADLEIPKNPSGNSSRGKSTAAGKGRG
ncbi:hypothetical protein BJV74DRAFT_794395 [Russula compacta]|nr:hypothetical protein BJV74DRAFT_794395 [Russula compacta]